MQINVFDNSSSSYGNGNEIDTSLLVQKHYLRTNYIVSNIEEDIDLQNQFRIKTHLILYPYEKQLKNLCRSSNKSWCE